MSDVGCVTYKTAFGMDDWIYLHLMRSHISGLKVITALSLFYTLYSYTCSRILSLH
jgi:hypothetical protein